MARQFQEYVDPGWEESAPQRRSEEEENVLLPLGENTLTHNLGLPMVVVCTKVRTRTHWSCPYSICFAVMSSVDWRRSMTTYITFDL